MADPDSNGSRENFKQTQLWTGGTQQSPRHRWDYKPGEATEKGTEEGREIGIPVYPPGPGERKRWAYLLREMPSVKPALCKLADGSTNRLSRNAELRALGNSVVPLTAARAFEDLYRKLTG